MKGDCEYLIEQWLNSYAHIDCYLEKLAYVLATVQHETAGTYLPIRERRASKDKQFKVYRLQSRYWLSGYYGRGYVQLTHKANYEHFGDILKIPLVTQPDLAMVRDTACRILFEGMLKGSFTGKKLSDFISEQEMDYYHARMIVNGMDKARLIAGLADVWWSILKDKYKQ